MTRFSDRFQVRYLQGQWTHNASREVTQWHPNAKNEWSGQSLNPPQRSLVVPVVFERECKKWFRWTQHAGVSDLDLTYQKHSFRLFEDSRVIAWLEPCWTLSFTFDNPSLGHVSSSRTFRSYAFPGLHMRQWLSALLAIGEIDRVQSMPSPLVLCAQDWVEAAEGTMEIIHRRGFSHATWRGNTFKAETGPDGEGDDHRREPTIFRQAGPKILEPKGIQPSTPNWQTLAFLSATSSFVCAHRQSRKAVLWQPHKPLYQLIGDATFANNSHWVSLQKDDYVVPDMVLS